MPYEKHLKSFILSVFLVEKARGNGTLLDK